MFKKYTIIALGALMLGGQASGMGSWARKLWAPSAVAAASVYTSKTTLCEEKPGCWQWFKAKMGWTQVKPKTGISEEILDLYTRSVGTFGRNVRFLEQRSRYGGLEIYSKDEKVLGLEIAINGSGEELSRPGINVERYENISTYDFGLDDLREGAYKDMLVKRRREGLRLRARILIAAEEARTKEQQEMIDSEVVQGDSYSGPGIYGLTTVVRADGTFLYSPTITPEERKIRERLSEVRIDLRTKCFAPELYGIRGSSVGSMRCVTAYKPEDLEKM